MIRRLRGTVCRTGCGANTRRVEQGVGWHCPHLFEEASHRGHTGGAGAAALRLQQLWDVLAGEERLGKGAQPQQEQVGNGAGVVAHSLGAAHRPAAALIRLLQCQQLALVHWGGEQSGSVEAVHGQTA